MGRRPGDKSGTPARDHQLAISELGELSLFFCDQGLGSEFPASREQSLWDGGQVQAVMWNCAERLIPEIGSKDGHPMLAFHGVWENHPQIISAHFLGPWNDLADGRASARLPSTDIAAKWRNSGTRASAEKWWPYSLFPRSPSHALRFARHIRLGDWRSCARAFYPPPPNSFLCVSHSSVSG
jgi:hypothetical protein